MSPLGASFCRCAQRLFRRVSGMALELFHANQIAVDIIMLPRLSLSGMVPRPPLDGSKLFRTLGRTLTRFSTAEGGLRAGLASSSACGTVNAVPVAPASIDGPASLAGLTVARPCESRSVPMSAFHAIGLLAPSPLPLSISSALGVSLPRSFPSLPIFRTRPHIPADLPPDTGALPTRLVCERPRIMLIGLIDFRAESRSRESRVILRPRSMVLRTAVVAAPSSCWREATAKSLSTGRTVRVPPESTPQQTRGRV
mmetsp:Transcript_52582/g.136163  ORF Transcript_52582/g.136163 Transcript_52582/m.136163 type:complete len:255 (+) Transcript_52582:215-979(+)